MRFLSLFSGIEAASVAWRSLGWQCAAVAEIEPFPCAVLKHHYPDVPNLGDITKITEADVSALGHIDIVVGGFPCQDLSVAGKRKGLINEDGSVTRSGLFFQAMRIVRWSGARFVLLENVPGIYSSNGGRDFATVVGEVLGAEFTVPASGWENAGVAASERGLFEWATLDAQYFGVAQRRRRMFAFGDFGDWRSRPPVLFERHSLSGHPAPSREAGKRVAPCLDVRAGRSGETTFHTSGGLIETLCVATGQAGAEIGAEIAPTLNCNHEAPYAMYPTAHTLRGEGFDASEDGTGRGTPLVPVGVTIHGTDGCAKVASYDELAQCLRARTPGNIDNSSTTVVQHPIAFDCKSSGQNGFGVGEIASTMRSMGHANSHQNGGGHLAVAFDTTQLTSPANYSNPQPGDPCHPLAAAAHVPAVAIRTANTSANGHGISENVAHTLDRAQGQAVAVSLRGREGGATAELGDEVGQCLRASNGGGDKPHVLTSMAVRRLTPKECERLQGFPDNYTLTPYRNKPAADGPRYKALGNSMAVPVMRWIGERIAQVEAIQQKDTLCA